MNCFTLLILSVGCLIVASPTDAQTPSLELICERASMGAIACDMRDTAESSSPNILQAVEGIFENYLDCDGKKDLVRQCNHVRKALEGNCDGDEEPVPTLDVVTCEQLKSFQGECRQSYDAMGSCASQRI